MSDERVFGSDLHLGLLADEGARYFAGPMTRGDLVASRASSRLTRAMDLTVVQGRANIAQAIILRLMTQRGELDELGHPSYGSRHHELVGELNTPTNRERVKLFILDCLREERRIERVLPVSVREGEGRQNREKVDITLTVQLRLDPDPLNLVVPFSFAGVTS